MDRVALALLCVAPAMIVPGGENRFVFAKVATNAAGVALAACAAGRGRLPRPVLALLGIGAALALIAGVVSAEPAVALIGRAPRFEGLPMLALYAGAGWAGARLLGPAPPAGLSRVLVRSLCVVAVAVAVLAVLETAGLRPLSSNVSRPGSLLGNASDQGALGVLLVGALGWAALAESDAFALTGLVAAGLAVALSASRAALLGALVTAAVLALASRGRRRLAVGAAVGALVVVTLAVPATRVRVSGTSPLAAATVRGRILLWEETLALIGHHPVLGVGPGNFLDAITVEHNLAWQREVGPANPPDSPHNWVLQVAAAGGLGLLAV
ncbi:MAG: O-antigen ligase family protein, partial [Acidimicrobiales bacterium]